METQEQIWQRAAQNGDIQAFQSLFLNFQDQLRSYLYRLLANRNDAEDLTHDTFIKAFDKLSTFKNESSLKTWVFQIGTNLAYNRLKIKKRWTSDVLEQAKNKTLADRNLYNNIVRIHETAPDARYDMKEHIDTCFTCIAKNLTVENQVAIILKDVYDFPIIDICRILSKTEGVIKYLLQDGRKTMMDIFDDRCSLINKAGVCHQCSELNHWFNPKQNQQAALLSLALVKGSKKFNRSELYTLRTRLVNAIDPLRSPGSDLQEILLSCSKQVMDDL
ncbi:RNA polymerase sigma factor [Spirosoma sp. 209]|uniref:RNA polymerase sigma factor n=1 Tax=Spirosoma sp. 209 TaxID=1955701 RepID=UPI00098D4680|nr:RNA polymerase sigma factor [Spirosoma sp. 209]PHK29783.1 RNA polymerase subunit sigma-24 [Nostoc linckia z16]